MTASERLERLDGEMTAGPWKVVETRKPHLIIDLDSDDYDADQIAEIVESRVDGMVTRDGAELFVAYEDSSALATLRNALPELVAVVKLVEEPCVEGMCHCCGAYVDETGHFDDCPLAALARKLEAAE
jgi:hypothetical protein